MRTARALVTVAYAGAFTLAAALFACAKTPPEAQSAPAASAATGGGDTKGGGSAAGGQDTVLPPGVDVSKLDELAKKIFFRVVNSEPSICGKGQSLLASAKKDAGCRRSLNAVRYVARLADQGYTQIARLSSRWRNATAAPSPSSSTWQRLPWRATPTPR